MKKILILLLLAFACGLLYFVTTAHLQKKLNRKTQTMLYGSITSSAFKNGDFIPADYTCDGENISPELRWHFKDEQQVIGGYVLIVDDPDAQKVVGKTFVHWALFLPALVTQLSEKISGEQEKSITEFNGQIVPLQNDFKTAYYKGPCPPAESGVHTYYFTIFALDKPVQHMQQLIENNLYTAEQFAASMGEHIVGKAVLAGRYGRKKDA